ncbi:glutamyl-tRNA(Gln) amidotransferase subunit E [bacterium BMS3Bbin04]|nr:glutamyl-tRNA(Gln) amidotransferase subunit E [bacterium BMS3Bbin04]
MRSGEVLARMMTALERREYAVDQLSIEQLEDLLNALGAGHIHREGLFDLLKAWTSTPSLTFVEMLERLEWTEIQEYQITTIIQEAIEIANGEAPRLPENLFRMAMGHAMDVLRGRVDSRIVLDKMKQLIG